MQNLLLHTILSSKPVSSINSNFRFLLNHRHKTCNAAHCWNLLQRLRVETTPHRGKSGGICSLPDSRSGSQSMSWCIQACLPVYLISLSFRTHVPNWETRGSMLAGRISFFCTYSSLVLDREWVTDVCLSGRILVWER